MTIKDRNDSDHLKGLWEATGMKAFGLSEIIATNGEPGGACLVAIVNQLHYEGGQVRQLPREMTDARARLIAETPALLATCESLLHAFEFGESIQERVAAARKVIARARGKEE